MADLSNDQLEMLAFLLIRNTCMKADRCWSVVSCGNSYRVTIDGNNADPETSCDARTFTVAVYGAINEAGLDKFV